MNTDLRDALHRLADEPAVRASQPPVLLLTARLRRRRATRLAAGTAVGVATAAGVVMAGTSAVERLQPPPPLPLAATPTTTPTSTPSQTPSVNPTREPTPAAASTPSATPEPAPTATAEPTPTTTPEPTPTATAEPTPTATTEPSPPPPAAELAHGGTAWAAYVAAETSPDDPPGLDVGARLKLLESDPAWVEAGERLERLGYWSGPGRAGCDLPAGIPPNPPVAAATVLGVDERAWVRAAYFTSKADAEAFASLYGDGVLGIVEVQTYCLD